MSELPTWSILVLGIAGYLLAGTVTAGITHRIDDDFKLDGEDFTMALIFWPLFIVIGVPILCAGWLRTLAKIIAGTHPKKEDELAIAIVHSYTPQDSASETVKAEEVTNGRSD